MKMTQSQSEYFGSFHQRNCARTLSTGGRGFAGGTAPVSGACRSICITSHLRGAGKKSTDPAITASVVHVNCMKTDPEHTSMVEFAVQSNSRKLQ